MIPLPGSLHLCVSLCICISFSRRDPCQRAAYPGHHAHAPDEGTQSHRPHLGQTQPPLERREAVPGESRAIKSSARRW